MTSSHVCALFCALLTVAMLVGLRITSMRSLAARTEIMRQLRDDRGWHFGLDIVEASGGKLAKGTVYIHLADLEEKGLVEACFEPPQREGHLPRRLYKITSLAAIHWPYGKDKAS